MNRFGTHTSRGAALSCLLVLTMSLDAIAAPPSESPVPPPEIADAPPPQLVPVAVDACRAASGQDICRPRRIGGWVLTGAGIAGLGAGIGLMFVPNQSLEPGLTRTYQPAGTTLIGGSILFITTGLFLIVDAVQRANRPRARGSSSRRSR